MGGAPMSEVIEVTRCGNCPVWDERGFRCMRLNMEMNESDPPCNWAVTGTKPEDFEEHMPNFLKREKGWI